MSIAGIVLAAGSSSRLGRPKQTVIIDRTSGETLLQRTARTALAAGLSPVYIVVGTDVDFGLGVEQDGCTFVVNSDPSEGMASSLRVGLTAAQHAGASGAVIMTCDQPLLKPQQLVALTATPSRITGSFYASRVGVPAYFPEAVFPDLLQLRGDAGARDLLRGAASIADESLAVDIDSEADIAEFFASMR